MKLFDDKFRENVDGAFSGYDAGHLADEGWNSFMELRKKAGKQRAFIIPFWAKAASIALIVGAGALTTYLFINHDKPEASLAGSLSKPEQEMAATANSGSSVPVSTVREENMTTARNKNKIKSSVPLISETTSTQPSTEEQPAQLLAIIPSDTLSLPVVAENYLPVEEDTVSQKSKEIIQEIVAEEDMTIASAEKKSRYTRPKFITGMSGVLAHVKDASSSAPGVAVGFYVEQKITKRISFRPGLALAVNSIGVSHETSRIDSYYQVSLIDGNSGTVESYNGELRMVAMELPLNIVFKVFERKRSGIYLSAGASTIVYFNQKFTGDFVNQYTQAFYNTSTNSMSYETKSSKVTVENSYSTLNHTDYFGLANFSAGYSIPYGKTSTLLFEPFMQLPLSDLTALNLRVRYGGVSIKLRFGGKNQLNNQPAK